MRKTIYICDRCGKESENGLYTLPHFAEMNNPIELCTDCMKKLDSMWKIFMQPERESFEDMNRKAAIANNEKKAQEFSKKYYTLDDIPNFGQRIVEYMNDNHLTNAQVARQIGVNPSVVSRWIHFGLERTNIRTETKINHFLNAYLMPDSCLRKEA